MLIESLNNLKIARRDLLINAMKGGGALVLGFNLPGSALFAADSSAALPGARKLDPARLDTWIAINKKGDVTAYWGKMDMGQGVDTAISQMVAEELDVKIEKVTVLFGDTYVMTDQGGASGSSGVSNSGVALREAAAEARQVLLEKASTLMNLPVDKLTVIDGVIQEQGNSTHTLSYGDIIGDKLFNVPLEWNGEIGNELELKSRAKLKDPANYKVVGTSVGRKDITGKIIPKTRFTVHSRVPGMLHGRMIRPPSAGATIVSVDKDSIAHIPGVQVVVEKDFIGVVAPKEWDAIRASRALKVNWDETKSGFPTTSEKLHDYIRKATADKSEVPENIGDVDAALASNKKPMEVEYEWPFQSHARMAASVGLADVKVESGGTVWTDSQKFYDTAICTAKMLGLKAEGEQIPVRSIWGPGPGSYGRSDSADGVLDAVVLSKAVGAPVRVQWMRNEGIAWDPKGPASVINMRAAIGEDGKVSAWHFHLKGFSRQDVSSREHSPSETLAGQLLGHTRKRNWTMSEPANSYGFANKRYSWDAIKPLRDMGSPLRTSHFRDPYGAEIHFAVESFVDEMAYSTGMDPVAFRLQYLTEQRDIDVIKAVADLAQWQPRTAARKQKNANGMLVGTGISYAQRNASVNAVIAEVEVNPQTGRVWVKRFFVGSDYGLIINPFTLDRTIEGNLIQGTSRTLFEEVKFDEKTVHSVDWATYPIVEVADAPEEVKIVKINRPELGPKGAGEPVTRVVPAAIANAVFDATGIRFRKAPLTAARVKAALDAAV